MSNELRNKRVAALVDNGFEQTELVEPKKALEAAGAKVDIVSPQDAKVKGWQHLKWGDEFPVNRRLDEAQADEYDALLLPGGVMNPDKLRRNEQAQRFVRHFFDEGKPVAAICHGPWTLVEADVVRGRTLTSWPSVRTDIRNAGGQWVDEEVHVDSGLVTSRNPDDLPAFCSKMVEEIAEGVHSEQREATVGS